MMFMMESGLRNALGCGNGSVGIRALLKWIR